MRSDNVSYQSCFCPHVDDDPCGCRTFHSFSRDHGVTVVPLPRKTTYANSSVNNEDGYFWCLPSVLFVKSHPQQGALLQLHGLYVLPFDLALIGIEWNTCCWQSIKAVFPGKAKWSVLFCWARLCRNRVPWQIAPPGSDSFTISGCSISQCICLKARAARMLNALLPYFWKCLFWKLNWKEKSVMYLPR